MNTKFKPLYKAFFITELAGEFNDFTCHDFHDKNKLHISDDYKFSYKKSMNREIYLLGYCLDIRDGALSVKEIVLNLLNTKDKDEFYDEVEYLNGRFTLIFINGSEVV